MSKPILVSGMRPTGDLHIGHYKGVIKKWLEYQDTHECFFFVADYHSLTTNPTGNSIEQSSKMIMDWLACGIDPDRSHIFLQSQIKELPELHLLLSMITSLNWLDRVPTVKENKESYSYGFLGYPLLMTADLMLFNADIVPVGVDQTSHIEIARKIIDKFNRTYQANFKLPEIFSSQTINGIDGKKMGKSNDNYILINESDEETTKKVMKAISDDTRLGKDSPGNPENCPFIYQIYQNFTMVTEQSDVYSKCKQGQRTCFDCKQRAARILNIAFSYIRSKRESFIIEDVTYALNKGKEAVQFRAKMNMELIRHKIGVC